MGCFQIINNSDNANNVHVGEKREKRDSSLHSSNLSLGAFLLYVSWKIIFPSPFPHFWIPDTHQDDGHDCWWTLGPEPHEPFRHCLRATEAWIMEELGEIKIATA